MKTKGSVLIIVLVILVIASIGFSTWQYLQIQDLKQTNQSPSADVTLPSTEDGSETAPPRSTEQKIDKITDPGVTWLSEPQKLADQNLFTAKAKEQIGEEEILYYKVATLDTEGEIVLSIFPKPGLGTTYSLFRFKKDSNGKFKFLSKASDDIDGVLERGNAVIREDIVHDSETDFLSISPPEFLGYRGETLVTVSDNWSLESVLYSANTKLTADQETGYGLVYIRQIERSSDANLLERLQDLVLRLADNTLVHYNVKSDFVSDSKIPNITWLDGTKNSTAFSKSGLGGRCGTFGSYEAVLSITATEAQNRLVAVGETINKEKIYAPKETSDVLYKKAYENYAVGRDANSEYAPITESEYVTKKPIFIYKDKLGRYIYFVSEEYQPNAECGKPVIYLYPEKEINISVSVGAEVTKSLPDYKGGWQVNASPSGQLKTADHQVYPYLFWEGLGYGNYPIIDKGFVVQKNQIESVLNDHLTQLGLNAKEKADFLEFWLPKMPNRPYIRLTWFGTNQMNELVPLSVSPRPDTVIRIFLDFEGLDNSIKIEPQKLSTIERKGFTLVEWGGLLIK